MKWSHDCIGIASATHTKIRLVIYTMARLRASGGGSHGAQRDDARAIKTQLFEKLGTHAEEYWQLLGALCTASIDRAEFHYRVKKWMTPACVPLHNALVLSILAQACSKSSSSGLGAGARSLTSPIQPRAALLDDADEAADALEPPVDGHDGRGLKRLRHMYAGLTEDERARLDSLAKQNASSAHTSASVWAGAGAELLEKKRKEDEKRRAIEDRRRTREVKSAIGASHWRLSAMQTAAQTETLRSRLSTTMQETLIRSVSTPYCTESHSLPDVHSLQDRMSLAAIEAGLSGGVHAQAAAVALSALQDYLQNILRRIFLYTRARQKKTVRPSRITIPDVMAVLDLAPHLIVEPLGQGPLECLLAPDGACPPSSSVDGKGVSWAEEDAVAHFARACATSKLAEHTVPLAVPVNADFEQAQLFRQQQQRDAVRNQVIIDQLAPLRLLDRRTLCESLAQQGKEKPSFTTPLSTALEQHYLAGQHHHHQHLHRMHRHKDELFDVIDPVALFHNTCE